jgi:NarL family two-component system response regulator LiaR
VRRGAALILIYGAAGGLLIAVLRVIEYHSLVVDHSVDLYGALIAALFAALGIWIGRTITRSRPADDARPAVPGLPFGVNDAKVREFGLTPRELEILGLMANGLSTREMAEALFVSENTVKTHASRLFDKLQAKRRTQAVQIGRLTGLIP